MQIMGSGGGHLVLLLTGWWSPGEPLNVAGGGQPAASQHLFWFLAHPEVYVLILPAMGIVAEVIANTPASRSGATAFRLLGGVPRLMKLRGLGAPHVHDRHGHRTMSDVSSRFTTMTSRSRGWSSHLRSSCRLYGREHPLTTPMLFATAFLPMFAHRPPPPACPGLTASDIYLHDTFLR